MNRYTVLGFKDYKESSRFTSAIRDQFLLSPETLTESMLYGPIEVLFLDRLLRKERFPAEYEPYSEVYFLNDRAVDVATTQGITLPVIGTIQIDDSRTSEYGVLLRA